MRKLSGFSYKTLALFLLTIMILHTAVSWILHVWLGVISAVLTVLAAAAILIYMKYEKYAVGRYLSQIAQTLTPQDRGALENFVLPCAVCTGGGQIQWYNTAFAEQVILGATVIGNTLSEITGYTFAEAQKRQVLDVTLKDKRYSVYCGRVQDSDDMVLYYVDNTRLKEIAEEYTASRPVVLSVFIDNLEDLPSSVRDAERAHMAGDVESLLENWLGHDAGILQKYDSDRFLIVTDKRRLEGMVRGKFEILDRVRRMSGDAHRGITLSIGVGQGKHVSESAAMAAQALEMALGRGGDQAAIKTKNGYDFYGGVSKGVERRTKVRTRKIASALGELIHNSSKVLIMGHAFSDMDSIGSAAALALMVKKRGKSAYVVLDREKTLARELVQYLEQLDNTLFIDPADAQTLIDANTLLIITDTHTSDRLDAVRLYDMAKLVVVIDHHRRMVNAIDNAVLFYHEPSASSTSEMVAELLQYMGDPAPKKAEAEALLAGIILDTRNFVLKAGARTFEAAAYLRRLGADTVKVQQLFAADMALYRQKSTLVSEASVYRSMAISTGEGSGSDIRVAASQAANELLSIRDIRAAFTLIQMDKDVNISARSLGDVNVQLIAEYLGGGGHLTMAGAYLKNTDIKTAVAKTKEAIDRYLEERTDIQ